MKDWLGTQKMVSNSVVDAIGRTIAEESKEHEVKKIVVDSCIERDLSKLKSEDRKFINEAIKNKCLVVLGGGQDAMNVTMTDCRAGKFEAKFYHKILQEEIGGVKGLFGPINALAFNPDGRR
ncbi:Eukaryotic translation initiation factor 3 subunit I [Zea mays]|uniref:Eukaryotic translation initiation factor 3 subunit I n=1 Tax=Zea mays TaxID=4577 RepID=A0A3L6FVR0_MAIZE|nr:Eukaryotic translation initiation factor 3 subunit I [Zea mays]